MSMDEDDDFIRIPFVLTEKHGGEYDNEAFNAGWSLAMVDAKLSIARDMDMICPPFMLMLKWKQMADLIAMSHEFVVKVMPSDKHDGFGFFMFGPPEMFKDED